MLVSQYVKSLRVVLALCFDLLNSTLVHRVCGRLLIQLLER